VRHDLPVASQDLLEAVARGVVAVEAEHVAVMGGCCSKTTKKMKGTARCRNTLTMSLFLMRSNNGVSLELTVAEAEAGDEVVLVERRQRLADDADGLLVGVGRVTQPVQALPAERLLP